MPVILPRYHALAEIRQAVLSTINGAIGAGGRLEGLQEVIIRDHPRGTSKIPGLEIVRREDVTVDQGFQFDTVDYTLWLTVWTSDKGEAVAGVDEAERLAHEAASLVKATGKLGLPYVSYIRHAGGQPVELVDTTRRRAGFRSTIVVTFTVIPS